jgi:hypothetical protein
MATQGPWRSSETQDDEPVVARSLPDAAPNAAQVLFEADWGTTDDAIFIAAARDDLPLVAADAYALVAEVRRLRARDIEREAWALRLLADTGDRVARALVNAPDVDGEPDEDERQIDTTQPIEGVPHAVILQQLLDRAAQEHAALTAEIERLRARDADWQRVTRVDDPACVHERNVRLCSCDDANLPQVGDEIDACETCDGLVKAPYDEPVSAPMTPAPRAQWVSRAARSQPATDAQPSREPNNAGGGP